MLPLGQGRASFLRKLSEEMPPTLASFAQQETDFACGQGCRSQPLAWHQTRREHAASQPSSAWWGVFGRRSQPLKDQIRRLALPTQCFQCSFLVLHHHGAAGALTVVDGHRDQPQSRRRFLPSVCRGCPPRAPNSTRITAPESDDPGTIPVSRLREIGLERWGTRPRSSRLTHRMSVSVRGRSADGEPGCGVPRARLPLPLPRTGQMPLRQWELLVAMVTFCGYLLWNRKPIEWHSVLLRPPGPQGECLSKATSRRDRPLMQWAEAASPNLSSSCGHITWLQNHMPGHLPEGPWPRVALLSHWPLAPGPWAPWGRSPTNLDGPPPPSPS